MPLDPQNTQNQWFTENTYAMESVKRTGAMRSTEHTATNGIYRCHAKHETQSFMEPNNTDTHGSTTDSRECNSITRLGYSVPLDTPHTLNRWYPMNTFSKYCLKRICSGNEMEHLYKWYWIWKSLWSIQWLQWMDKETNRYMYVRWNNSVICGYQQICTSCK